VKFDNMRAE